MQNVSNIEFCPALAQGICTEGAALKKSKLFVFLPHFGASYNYCNKELKVHSQSVSSFRAFPNWKLFGLFYEIVNFEWVGIIYYEPCQKLCAQTAFTFYFIQYLIHVFATIIKNSGQSLVYQYWKNYYCPTSRILKVLLFLPVQFQFVFNSTFQVQLL